MASFYPGGQFPGEYFPAVGGGSPPSATGSAVGSVGIRGSAVGSKGAVSTVDGKVGAAASEVAQKGALGIVLSTLGAGGASTGAEGAANVSIGRLGAAGSSAGSRKALAASTAALGASGSTQGSKAVVGAVQGRDGVSGVATGGNIIVAFGSAEGTDRLSGSAEGVAGPARLEGSGGPRRRRGKRTLFFTREGIAVGAVGIAGSVRGLAFIPPPEKEFDDLAELRELLARLLDRARERIHRKPTPAERVEQEDFSFPELDDVEEAVGFMRGANHGITGAVQGRAAFPEPVAPPAPMEVPAASPRLVLGAEPVVAAGAAIGALGVACEAIGLASIPLVIDDGYLGPDEELELMMIVDLVLDEEFA